ncbi:MAG TPA: cupin domain-containing protein [Gemmatimonadaceae bacterium]|jgi:mannose-6-phosphate isomerase-like protein (cupin superfamily)|nr:cupin domain-containing protein [Gemmatimonadaceae bacterium]
MTTISKCGSVLLTLLIAAAAGSCAAGSAPARSPSSAARVTAGSDRPIPVILAADEGERRTRRTLGGARLFVKVDPETARSPEFVMTMEAIPVGEAIPLHAHPSADEIIFIHRGSGRAQLDTRSSSVTEGATIYIPRSTRVALRNTGSQPLVIIAIFSQTGFESYLRDTSVPAGQPVVPLTPAQLRSVRSAHEHDIVFENP